MKKLSPFSKYTSISLLALTTVLAGCGTASQLVSMQLTLDSAENVRSGQYCEEDLKTAFSNVFGHYIKKDNWENASSGDYYQRSENGNWLRTYSIKDIDIRKETSQKNCSTLPPSFLPGQARESLSPAHYIPGTNDATAVKTNAAATMLTTGVFSSSNPKHRTTGRNETISIRIKDTDVDLVHRGMFCESDLAKAFEEAVIKFKNGNEAIADLNIPQNPLQNCQVQPKMKKLSS